MGDKIFMNLERFFLPENEIPAGFKYPQSYVDFVNRNKPSGVAILGMPPWIFSGDSIWAAKESKTQFGVWLVPFAQAEGMDMMSYFEASGKDNPPVWIANPWEQLPQYRIYEKFESFDQWLLFAKKISSDLISENPQYKEKTFWYPDHA